MPILAGIAATLIKNLIVEKATTLISKHDATPDKEPVDTAHEIATAITPEVISLAVSSNKALATAVNAEPIYKSKNFWLGFGTTIASAGTLVQMIANHNYDFAVMGTTVAGLMGGIGMMVRRAVLQT